MPPRSSPWCALEGHWHTALSLDEWHSRFGGEVPPAIMRWLRPGPPAHYVPCLHQDGCHQPHRLVRDRRGQWLAVPEEPDCESFLLTEDALSTLALDLPAACHEISETLGLDEPSFELVREYPHVVRIGQLGKRHAPCFLVFSSSARELAAACDHITARVPGPIFVLTTHAEHVTTDLCARLRGGGAAVAAFSGLLAFDAKGRLVATCKVATLLPSAGDPRAPALSARAAFSRGNTWPHARPARPTWADVSLTLQLQEVHIRFGESQGSFDYRDIDGFTDRRGGKRPNRRWALLRAFAMRDGLLPLPTKAVAPVRLRTLAELDAILRRFFGILEPAFERLAQEGVVRARPRVTAKA